MSAPTYVRSSFQHSFEVTYLADWLASIDGQYHYCHRWIPRIPARNVRQVFVTIHGLGDHGGRFDTFARYMASRGIAVQAIDLTGHGRSPGKRGRIRSYEALLSEIRWSLREANQVWQNADVTLLGHSMGGNLVLNYAERFGTKEQIDAPEHVLSIDQSPARIIAVAPMLRPYGVQIREDFLRVGCYLSKWVPNWPIRMNHRPETLTGDPAMAKAYRDDPLVHSTMSIRLGIELLLAGRKLIQSQVPSRIPCLLLHGDADKLADIDGSKAYCRNRDYAAMWELPGELHDPLNGIRKQWIYAKIASWCDLYDSAQLSDLKLHAA